MLTIMSRVVNKYWACSNLFSIHLIMVFILKFATNHTPFQPYKAHLPHA